jgi:hypothetical protein
VPTAPQPYASTHWIDPGQPGAPAFWNNTVYYLSGADGAPIDAFSITNGLLEPTPVSHSIAAFNYPGGVPTISANNATDGIVWVLETGDSDVGPVVLHAFDANDLTNELYNSNEAGTRDIPGIAVKFTVPTVADGKVFVGTADQLNVFGILPDGLRQESPVRHVRRRESLDSRSSPGRDWTPSAAKKPPLTHMRSTDWFSPPTVSVVLPQVLRVID